jgi:DNA-directed RNA polymerase beta subunit
MVLLAASPKQKEAPTTALKLKEALSEKEREFKFKDDIFGATLLTNPGYISSSRNIMFTSHLRQAVNLCNPDFPLVFTHYENIVGKNSTGYYKAKANLEVVDRIAKFENGVQDDHIYLMFVYDKDTDTYDVIEKKIVEDLTEKFGFSYDNDNMDSKQVGDKVKKGEVLYKTRSYDENMNYCYGKNIKFVYMLENNTIEDAIVVSESLSKKMESKEIETVKISLNDNDILCNIYGDNDNYKGFPNIGELVNNRIVCSKRRIHNSQLLYDLKKSNLRKINYSSDVLYFCEGKVVDINIYCNKPLDKIERNSFNAQLIYYLEMQENFYRNLYLRCKKIIESGSEYSADINYYYKKAKNYLDENYKWREEDNSVFSNMIVEFVIERDIGLSVGQKITGRYGNKGVISKIRPDDEMPFLETGERVDAIFNSLGVINRLNSQQLFEQSMTFIANRTRERLATLPSIEEKTTLLLRLFWHFNRRQEEEMRKYIKALSKKQKEAFFESVINDGIYIHNPPMWEEEPMFDRLRSLYKEFDWIKPYDVFVNKFGRKIKILKPLVVGDMYVLKLKQTSKKGFSVRSTGGLSKKGLPEKTNKAKTHQELYSKTPIRIGDQENINAAIGVDTEVIAQLHLFYRSSVIGRRDMGEALMTSLKELNSFSYSQEFTNRNIEILNAYLLYMGLKIEFSDDKFVVKINTDIVKAHMFDERMFLCTEAEFEEMKIELEIRKKYAEDALLVGTVEEVEAIIQREIEMAKRKEKNFVVEIS